MKRWIVFLLVPVLFLTSCGWNGPMESSVFAMDTLMDICIWGNTDDLNSVTDEIFRLDHLLSANAPDSDVSMLNQSQTQELSGDVLKLLQTALALSEETNGAFDPTVYPLVRLWGFPEAEYCVPSQEEIDKLLPCIGIDHVHREGSKIYLDEGTMLDFGAIAKGYTSQHCIDFLRARGVSCALLSLGGNVQTLGTKPDGSMWTVGIADPEDPSEPIAALAFSGDLALVTSGGYQRYFEEDGMRYHHILDPKTGYPAENDLASVTVLCQDGTTADAYSTALFVMGLEKAAEFYRTQNNFEAVFITKDRRVFATEGCAVFLSGVDFSVIER